MAHLCDLKLSASITATQLNLWYDACSGFSPRVINSAALTLALQPGRFPDFSDLYHLCKREAVRRGERQVPYSPHGTGGEAGEVTTIDVKEVAERLGLDV